MIRSLLLFAHVVSVLALFVGRAAASHSILRLSLRVRVAFGLAVVYLMIGKPDAAGSLLVMGLAFVLTIATSVSKRQPQSTLAEGYR